MQYNTGKSYNPAFAAGVEVHYRSGFGQRLDGVNSSNVTLVKIARVTPNGAFFYIEFPAAIPGNPPRVVKFRTPTHGDYAREMTDSNYGATVHLLTEEHLKNVAEGDVRKNDKARRQAVASILSDANLIRYHMKEDDLAVLETLLAKYKAD